MRNTNGHKTTDVDFVTGVLKTSGQLKRKMLDLVTNLERKRVTPMVANAMCNATGKTLKIVEMEYKYGNEKRKPRQLQLAEKN